MLQIEAPVVSNVGTFVLYLQLHASASLQQYRTRSRDITTTPFDN